MQLRSRPGNCSLGQSDASSTRSCTGQYKALPGMEHKFLIVHANHPPGSQSCIRRRPQRRRSHTHPLGFLLTQHNVIFVYSILGAIPQCALIGVPAPSYFAEWYEDDEPPSHPAYDGVQVSHDGTSTSTLAGPPRALFLTLHRFFVSSEAGNPFQRPPQH